MTTPTTTPSSLSHQLVRRAGLVLSADPQRVVARLFVPGDELELGEGSRAGGVVGRVLDLSEETVSALITDVRERWSPRHRDLESILATSFAQIAHRVPAGTHLSEDRRALLGAYFTQEQAIEAAALFNPSLVAHPDQHGLPEGALRVVMSVRAVGEGHISCIEFRTGVLSPDGELAIQAPGRHAEVGETSHATYHKRVFGANLLESGADEEATAYLMSQLADSFTLSDLHSGLTQLLASHHGRRGGEETAVLARRLAEASYEVEFDPATTLAERVLRPFSPQESHGLEDARFVAFEDDGETTYRGTYTAYNGHSIRPQLLETSDFRRFRVSTLSGPAATDKGIALFPRKVHGVHLALTRSDRETSGVAVSTDGIHWSDPTPILRPSRPQDLIQTGNCGSPLETKEGWLVLTHGVGPMREYTLGALLLDLDDPTQVIGQLDTPLLRPQENERDGYVPNVVYSCGGLVHGDVLALPYGSSDAAIRYAVVDLPALLERLKSTT